jgi:hypothetical protein
MKIKKIACYTFEELSQSSKERAVANFSDRDEYPWFDEVMASATAFVEHFGAKITNYSIGAESYRGYVKTTIEPSSFRGMKLKDFSRDHMPTGYCMDCDIWGEFYDEFKKTGHAHHAFNMAIESFLNAVARDVEHYFSFENIGEMLTINEYEFHDDGNRFYAVEAVE